MLLAAQTRIDFPCAHMLERMLECSWGGGAAWPQQPAHACCCRMMLAGMVVRVRCIHAPCSATPLLFAGAGGRSCCAHVLLACVSDRLSTPGCAMHVWCTRAAASWTCGAGCIAGGCARHRCRGGTCRRMLQLGSVAGLFDDLAAHAGCAQCTWTCLPGRACIRAYKGTPCCEDAGGWHAHATATVDGHRGACAAHSANA